MKTLVTLFIIGLSLMSCSKLSVVKEFQCSGVTIKWLRKDGWSSRKHMIYAVNTDKEIIFYEGYWQGLTDVSCKKDTILLKVYNVGNTLIDSLATHILNFHVKIDSTVKYYDHLKFYQPKEYEKARKHPKFDSLYDFRRP